MNTSLNTFQERIRLRSICVGVIGLGYVGLPLAKAFAESGFSVIGFDNDTLKVSHLRLTNLKTDPEVADRANALQQNPFELTDDFRKLSFVDAVIICVPTPLTHSRTPDLTAVIDACRRILNAERFPQLVVLESTSYPGTSRTVVLPELGANSKKAGQDYYFAYSPERIDPGRKSPSLKDIPKIVGGFDDQSLELACALYGAIIDNVVPVKSLEIAEACKMLENTYRSINIALVNEFKMLLSELGIDVWEVIDAAKTKPFGFQSFSPGPGAGGHCIPVDPLYLCWLAKQINVPMRMVEAATQVNESIPHWVADKVIVALSKAGKILRNSRVLLLGASYKANVSDIRESPALIIMDRLHEGGAIVRFSDPFVPIVPNTDSRFGEICHSLPLSQGVISQQDVVLVITDHDEFDWHWISNFAKILLSTRRLPISDYQRI